MRPASVAAEIESAGGKAMAIRTDVSSEDEVKAMVEQVMNRFGRIDVLHNNACGAGCESAPKRIVISVTWTWMPLIVPLAGEPARRCIVAQSMSFR